MRVTRATCASAPMPALCPLEALLPRPAGLSSPPGPSALGLVWLHRQGDNYPSNLDPLFLHSCVAGTLAHPPCLAPFHHHPNLAQVFGSAMDSGPQMPWKRTQLAVWKKRKVW